MAERELAQLVKKLRHERGLTQGQLAEYAGVSRSWLSHVEGATRKRPEREMLERIASVLRVPPSTLLATAGYRVKPLPPPPPRLPEELLHELEAAIARSPVLVPVTEQPAAAGYGLEGAAEYLPYMPEPAEHRHKFIGVEVRGECLEPRIRPGEHVIVDTDASPHHGDIVLAAHDGEIIVKLLEKRNGDMYLIALKKRPPLRVNEDTRILGVVKMVMRRP